MIREFMKAIVASVALVGLTAGATLAIFACTPAGRLDPRVPEVATIVDETGCNFVPASVKGVPAAQICKALAGLLNGILGTLTATPGATDGQRTFAIAYRGRVIAKDLTRAESDRIRQAFSDPTFGARVDATLASDGGVK